MTTRPFMNQAFAACLGSILLLGASASNPVVAAAGVEEGDLRATRSGPIGIVESDVIYGRVDALAMTYDIIKPTAEPNGATVIFMVSGGWVSRWFDPRMAMLPKIRDISLVHDLLVDGYHIVLLRHGSSPRYKVPDAVDHVEKAIRHLRSTAPDRGLDPERIGSFGLSAGGHLSLHLATLGGEDAPRDIRRSRLGRDAGVPEDAAPIAAAVAWFPPVELVGFVGPNERYPAMDFDPKDAARVSPIRHVDQNDAPVLLMHGTEDDVVRIRASEAMHETYVEAGLESEYHRFEGAGHGFEGEDAARSSTLAKAWFDRWLLPPAAPASDD